MTSFFVQLLEDEMKEGVEKFMVDGKHHSHDHPLSLREDIEEDGNEDDDLCGICGVPILSSPSYNCTAIDCKYFLHKGCAVKLTSTLIHSTHGPDIYGLHVLHMRERSPSSSSSSSSSSNYTYKCKDCKFETQPLSAVVGGGVEIKIKHRSHPAHQLVAFCREIVSLCDACGREEKGFFFSCQLCNFWIHQHCTILPSAVMLHSHPQPYLLTYSPPIPRFNDRCQVCQKPLPVRLTGVYFCPHYATFAHIACASNKDLALYKRRVELVQLPEDEREEFPSKVIRRYAAETNPLGPDAYYHHQQFNFFWKFFAPRPHHLTIEKYHNHHPLILDTPPHDGDVSTGPSSKKSLLLACDLCTQPIDCKNSSASSSFHRCGKCQFVAHKICADILPNIAKFFIPYGSVSLGTRPYLDPGKGFFNSVFYCPFCRRPCNGLCSHFPTIYVGWDSHTTLCIDLDCIAAPITVNHASHPGHLLFRTNPVLSERPPHIPCCPDTSLATYDVYRCIICNYFIHISCAMLPKRIRFREYHRPHPLYLIYDNSSTAAALFCEVCEEGIDLKYWLYRCIECDESYHINCIPSVGYLSKVKFGGKLSLPSSVHDHPLTLTRMLTLPSQRCGDCKQIVHGMVDEMAFFCSLCHFWLHFFCARNSAAAHTSDPLRLYWDYKKRLRMFGSNLM